MTADIDFKLEVVVFDLAFCGKIIEILNSKGITVHEEPIAASDIASFDAAFISGTSPKVLPIAQMENTTYDVNDPLLRDLMNWYDQTLD